MLMDREKAYKLIDGMRLAKTARTNHYNGKNFYDVRNYSGRLGVGYTVTHNGVTSTYISSGNIVSDAVYKGGFDVSEAVDIADAVRVIDFNGVIIAPTWELELDTMNGDFVFHRTDIVKGSSISGRTLKISWVGRIDEKTLRRKIKRRMYLEVKNGNCEVVK